MARAGTVFVDVRADTTGFLRDVSSAGQTAARNMSALAMSGAQTVLSDMARTAGVAALGLGVLGGAALKASTEFDAAMSSVQAVSGASLQELEQLREAALDAGRATVFSASEAAVAQGELARAGIATADILGGALSGALDLAAAGQLDLGRAAEVSAQAMNMFNLRGSDVSHVADVLAAGANKSAADVNQLAQAMSQGGLVAGQLGVGLEDTVGTLALFADNALVGSDAGTSLKTLLQRLAPQSAEAAQAMDALGLSFFDANGRFVGMAEAAQRMQTAFGGMSDEQRIATMTTIFGADAIRSASLLYEAGAEGVREYTAAVNDQGAAQRMAATMLDNLKGDLEEFKGSAETGLIVIGDLLDGTARSMVQAATAGVNGFLEFADTPAFDRIETRLDQLGGRAVEAFGGITDGISSALAGVSVADVDAFFDRVESGFAEIGAAIDGVEPLIVGVGAALGAMALSSIPVLGAFVPAISPVTAALAGLVASSDEGRAAIERLGEAAAAVGRTVLADVVPAVRDVADDVGGGLGRAFADVGAGVAGAAAVLGPVLGDAIRRLGPPVGELVGSLGRLAGDVLPDLAAVVGSVVGPAVGALAPVLGAAADAMGFLADHSELVIPALGAIAGFKLAQSVSGWVGPLRNLGDAIGQVGQIAATRGVSNMTAFGGVLASSATGAVGSLSTALVGALNPAVLGVTAAVAAGVGIYSAWSSAKADAAARTRDLADALASEKDTHASTAEALRSALSDLRGDRWTQQFNDAGLSVREVSEELRAFPGAMDAFRGEFHKLGENWETFDAAVELAEEAGHRIPDAVFKIRDAVKEGLLSEAEGEELINILTDLDKSSAVAVDNIETQFRDLQSAAEDAGINLDTFKARFDAATSVEGRKDVIADIIAQFPELAGAIGETGMSAEETQRQIEGLIGALDALAGRQLAADQAQQQFTLSNDRLLQSLAQNGVTLDMNTAAGARNRQALDGMVEAGIALAEAQARTDTTGQQSKATYDQITATLLQVASQAGMSEAEIRALLGAFGLLPEQVQTRIEADTAAARSEAQQIRDQLSALPGVPGPVRAKIEALLNQGQVLQARAELERFNRTYTTRVNVELRPTGSLWDQFQYLAGNLIPKPLNIGGPAGRGADGMIRMDAGGFLPDQALIQPAAPGIGLINWAEPETHGEAFIPLAPSKRKRSKDIWWETGRRLGVVSMAWGGFTSDDPARQFAEVLNNAWELQFDAASPQVRHDMAIARRDQLAMFSDEWMRFHQMALRAVDEINSEAEQAARAQTEAARDRERINQEIADNRWQFAFDRAGRDEQLRMARQRRDSFAEFTDEWMRFNSLVERLEASTPEAAMSGRGGGGGGSGFVQNNNIRVEAQGLVTDPVGVGLAVTEALKAAVRAGADDPWEQR